MLVFRVVLWGLQLFYLGRYDFIGWDDKIAVGCLRIDLNMNLRLKGNSVMEMYDIKRHRLDFGDDVIYFDLTVGGDVNAFVRKAIKDSLKVIEKTKFDDFEEVVDLVHDLLGKLRTDGLLVDAYSMSVSCNELIVIE